MPFKRFRMSMVTQVLLALALGIFCGLFFGEETRRIGIIGDIYIGLLQMTVLPYLIIALILGIGRLDPAWAARIGARGVGFMALLWVASFLVILAIPLAYPDWPVSSAFSSILEPKGTQTDLLGLFLPSNVFRSLSENLVPAVVFFCIILGIALMQVKDKDGVLSNMGALLTAITKVASFAVKLAPFGIFAIAADAAGSIEIEQFGRLTVYFLSFGMAWALMYFLLMPLILSAATPVSYWKLMQATHVAAVTAFATNSTLVVLPLMIATCKELLEESEFTGDETNASVDVLIPASYSLPNSGDFLNLGFVLFAAWFVGSPLEGIQNLNFAVIGGLFSVAGMIIAMPMMLDFFQLPADLFQLYFLAGVLTSRFSTALGVNFGIVLSLLVAFSVVGRFSLRRALIASAAGVAACVVGLVAFGFVLGGLSADSFDDRDRYKSAALMMDPVEAKAVEVQAPFGAEDAARPRLDVIRERGSLRVGYRADAFPYSFANAKGEIVGFDIELVNALARDLDVTLEFTRINATDDGSSLANGQLDLITGGVSITNERAVKAAFSDFYFEDTVGFVVLDHRRNEFVSLDEIRKMESLTLAVPRSYRPPILSQLLPNAKFVPMDSARDYVTEKHPEIDALLFGAQTAFAWTLSYPEYSITIPQGMSMKVPFAFLLPPDAPRLMNFVNTWLTLNKEHGLVKLAHDHWILGTSQVEDKPRWSIMRDVLHWVE